MLAPAQRPALNRPLPESAQVLGDAPETTQPRRCWSAKPSRLRPPQKATLANAGRKVATLERALYAIAQAHRAAGFVSPNESYALRQVLRSIRRTLGTAQVGKRPFLPEHLRSAATTAPPLLQPRDRALHTLAAGLRPRERRALHTLAVSAVAIFESEQRATVTFAKGTVNLSAEAFEAVKQWLEAARITEGPLFRVLDKTGTKLLPTGMRSDAVLRSLRAGATLPLRVLRNRALLAVGLAGGFRRSELVGIQAEEVAFTADGVIVTLPKSKTDQEGAGMQKGLPFGSNPLTCPVRTLQRWLEASGITTGPVFRAVNGRSLAPEKLADRSVARLVKTVVARAGLDAASYSGHSLRAGLATAAAKAGKSERTIMKQTGHKTEKMVRKYIREATLFEDNAAGGIGL